MKTHLNLLVSVVIVALALVGCGSKKDSSNVKVEVNVKGGKAQSILIASENILNGYSDTLAFSKLDSNGRATLEFRISQMTFAYFQIGENFGSLLLRPDDDFQITLDYNSPNSVPFFKGKGADIDNYIAKTNVMRDQYEMLGGKSFSELETNAFLDRLDSLENAFAKFHRTYTDSIAIPKDIGLLLQKRNEMAVLFRKENHFLANFANKNGQVVIPEKLKNIENQVPFDDILFETNMGEYRNVLLYYFVLKFEFQLFEGKTEKEKQIVAEQLSLHIEQAIKKGNYPYKVKEFLMAKNTYRNLSLMGINSITDSVFHGFKKEFPKSKYLSQLEKRYKKWEVISKGKLPPNFKGKTPDGKELSLSDLKGKVVYIDVWATWCRPCVEEFPHAKKIKQQFEGNNQVVFLYVSIDSDVQSWKKYLKSNPSLKGVHINLSNEQCDFIFNSYQMDSIPQFMLIDQAGNIVSVKAPRPSSGKVAEEIQKLLKSKSL